MCDRLGLGVLALGPAAMFAVLMILAITTIVGALRSDIHNCTRVNCNPGSNPGCLLLRLRLGDLRTDRVVQPLPPPRARPTGAAARWLRSFDPLAAPEVLAPVSRRDECGVPDGGL
jgi:hypothetical protein